MKSGRVALLPLAAALVLSALAPAQAADRALLIGIDNYQDPRVPATPGAADDARELAEMARSSFGFAPDSVRLLLNDEATSERIESEFRSWLVEGSAPGDRVFFLYAGHGSQLPDDNGDEDDAYDETLAPYDVDPMTGGNQIRDDVLGSLVAQLTGRRAVLLFDSCHSGTITRGMPALSQFPQGGGARYLPRPEDFKLIWGDEEEGYTTRSGGKGYILEGVQDDANRSLLDGTRGNDRLSGIVVISAAGPGQLAFPIATEPDHYRGALSYVFQQLYGDNDLSRGLLSKLRKKSVQNVGGAVKSTAVGAVTGVTTGNVVGATAEAVGTTLTVGALETAIDAGVQQLQSTGQLQGGQDPWFEVISEYPIDQEPLFGGWQQGAAVALNNPVSATKVAVKTAAGRNNFRAGEKLEFDVSSDQPGFLYLLIFSEQRVATCIYPNPDRRDNRIVAGTLRLPDTEAYTFPVQEPFGRDVVVALVAQKPLELCDRVVYSWDEVYERVDLRSAHEVLRKRSERGVGVQSAISVDDIPGGSWQAASLVVETTP